MNSGAEGIIIMNNEDKSFTIKDPSVLKPLTIPVIMLSRSVGDSLSGEFIHLILYLSTLNKYNLIK